MYTAKLRCRECDERFERLPRAPDEHLHNLREYLVDHLHGVAAFLPAQIEERDVDAWLSRAECAISGIFRPR